MECINRIYPPLLGKNYLHEKKYRKINTQNKLLTFIIIVITNRKKDTRGEGVAKYFLLLYIYT